MQEPGVRPKRDRQPKPSRRNKEIDVMSVITEIEQSEIEPSSGISDPRS
jgi:hypothetical protein